MNYAARRNQAIPIQKTVRATVELWFRTATVGRKPKTLEDLEGQRRVFFKHWPCPDASPGKVTVQDCLLFAERMEKFSCSFHNKLIRLVWKIVPASSVLRLKRVAYTERHLPNKEELDRLLAELDRAKRGEAALFIRLLIHTGLRRNEAANLTWFDVREDHIRVRAEFSKNGRSRVIPFIPGVEPVLAALRAISSGPKVFSQFSCKTAIWNACRRAGLPPLGHHAFRHLFATRCIAAGVDVPTVAKWLGHSDNGALLLKTYCHLMEEHSLRMAKTVNLAALPPSVALPTPQAVAA